jgi:hypothetical protein
MKKRHSGRQFGAAAGIAAVSGIMLLCITAWGLTSCSVEDDNMEEGNKITSFKIGEALGSIHETEQVIDVFVPAGTDLKALTPVVTVSSNASVYPPSGTEVNFSHPVSYTVTAENGVSQSYKVTVLAEDPTATLERIDIRTLPARTIYEVGETFDPSGMVIVGVYSDGSVREETEYTLDPSPVLTDTADEAIEVTVSVRGKDAPFTVTVRNARLESITVATLKDSYAYDEALDPAGIAVTGHYSDGTTRLEAPLSYTVSNGYDPEKSGSQTLLVTLNGKTATFTVTVGYPAPPVTLSSISVTTLKASYAYGEELDPAGISVRGYYSDGTDKIEAPADETTPGYTVSGYNSEKSGSQTLLVTLNGKTATFTVTVGYPDPAVTLSSISVTTLKASYAYGEELDPAGISVRGYYSNGTDKIEEAENYTVTGYAPEKPGYQKLLVTLDGKTATFSVIVGTKPVERNISVSIGLPNTNKEPEIFGIPEGGIKLSTSQNGLPDKIVISVANNGLVYSNVTWYVDGSPFNYSNNIITIEAVNYTLKLPHYITFTGTKDNIEYSRTITFTVER